MDLEQKHEKTRLTNGFVYLDFLQIMAISLRSIKVQCNFYWDLPRSLSLFFAFANNIDYFNSNVCSREITFPSKVFC